MVGGEDDLANDYCCKGRLKGDIPGRAGRRLSLGDTDLELYRLGEEAVDVVTGLTPCTIVESREERDELFWGAEGSVTAKHPVVGDEDVGER